MGFLFLCFFVSFFFLPSPITVTSIHSCNHLTVYRCRTGQKMFPVPLTQRCINTLLLAAEVASFTWGKDISTNSHLFVYCMNSKGTAPNPFSFNQHQWDLWISASKNVVFEEIERFFLQFRHMNHLAVIPLSCHFISLAQVRQVVREKKLVTMN